MKTIQGKIIITIILIIIIICSVSMSINYFFYDVLEDIEKENKKTLIEIYNKKGIKLKSYISIENIKYNYDLNMNFDKKSKIDNKRMIFFKEDLIIFLENIDNQ